MLDPGTLTATLTLTASHANAVSGACATIASCVSRPTVANITSPCRLAAAPRESDAGAWPARRAPHGRRCPAAVPPDAGPNHHWAGAPGIPATGWDSTLHHHRHRRHP